MWNRAGLTVLGLALFGAAVAMASSVPGAQPAHALTNCETTTEAINGNEQAMLDLLNAYRESQGAGALTVSPNLSRAAAFMAEDMTEKQYFSHFEPGGRSPFQRAVDCGYPSSNVGENLAIAGSAQGAINLFKSSPTHNQNMLLTRWKVVGIGQFGGYWALVFGASVDSGVAAPTATATKSPTPTPTPVGPIRRATLQMIASE